MPDDTTVTEIEVRCYGPRKYPIAVGRIPLALLADYNKLYAEVLADQPMVTTHERLIRYIWTRGLHSLRAGVSRSHLPNLLDPEDRKHR